MRGRRSGVSSPRSGPMFHRAGIVTFEGRRLLSLREVTAGRPGYGSAARRSYGDLRIGEGSAICGGGGGGGGRGPGR